MTACLALARRERSDADNQRAEILFSRCRVTIDFTGQHMLVRVLAGDASVARAKIEALVGYPVAVMVGAPAAGGRRAIGAETHRASVYVQNIQFGRAQQILILLGVGIAKFFRRHRSAGYFGAATNVLDNHGNDRNQDDNNDDKFKVLLHERNIAKEIAQGNEHCGP